jgi:hypothetical protein
MQQQGRGALVGHKGVKYGLQRPASKAQPAGKEPSSALWGDSDDDDDVGAQIMRQAEKKRQESKVGARGRGQ